MSGPSHALDLIETRTQRCGRSITPAGSEQCGSGHGLVHRQAMIRRALLDAVAGERIVAVHLAELELLASRV